MHLDKIKIVSNPFTFEFGVSKITTYINDDGFYIVDVENLDGSNKRKFEMDNKGNLLYVNGKKPQFE